MLPIFPEESPSSPAIQFVPQPIPVRLRCQPATMELEDRLPSLPNKKAGKMPACRIRLEA
jgi:hypothetical protein